MPDRRGAAARARGLTVWRGWSGLRRYGRDRWFPFLQWWPRVGRDTLRADAIAGLTGAMVLVPQAVAFATIAGMPPEFGLYAAVLPAIVAALWGSSWHLVSGPTTAISIVVFATISPLAPPGSPAFVSLVLTLTLLMGAFQLMLGLLRLGTLVNFVSHTVVIAFTTGAAVLIATSQFRNFFGIDVPRGASVYVTLMTLLEQAPSINAWSTLVGLVTVGAGLLAKRRWTRGPHMVVALVVGSVAAALANALVGVERTRLATIGSLNVGLPPLSVPDLSWTTIEKLAPIAIAVALLGLTEAVSIGRALATRTGQRIDGNQEFIGQRLSNLAGAFFSGYASSGSFNRSGLNLESGARTPMAAVLSAVLLLAIMVFLGPLAKYLPTAAMAGVLFVVAAGLVDVPAIREIVHWGRQEVAVFVATLFSTLVFNLEYAIYIGVLISLLAYLQRTSRPRLEDVKPMPGVLPPAFVSVTGLPDCPQVKIVRVNGSIFFGAADHLQRHFERLDGVRGRHRHLLLIASGINFVDLAGAQLLEHEARRRRAMGGSLLFYNVKPDVMETLGVSSFSVQ